MKNNGINIDELFHKAGEEAKTEIQLPFDFHKKAMGNIEKQEKNIFYLKVLAPAGLVLLLVVFFGLNILLNRMNFGKSQMPEAAIMALEGQSYLLNPAGNNAVQDSLRGIIILKSKKGNNG
jgi:hypothetical protein